MALLDDHLDLATNDPTGKLLFALKELAVSAGWNVLGSGDGQARWGYTGQQSVDLADRGSGGEFDCWLAAPADMASTDAGDVNADAWCVLENDGRELLLVVTTQASSSYAGYGRVLYSPKGGGGFDGSVAAADTIPGAATIELEVYGARASANGVALFTDGAGKIHLFADDAAENGVLALGFVATLSTLAITGSLAICPIVSGTESPADGDPAVLAYGVTGFGTFSAFNPQSGAMVAFTPDTMSFYQGNGAVDPSGPDRVAEIPAVLNLAPKVDKGAISPKALIWSGSPRVYPDLADGNVNGAPATYCYASSGMLFPWPDALTDPLTA